MSTRKPKKQEESAAIQLLRLVWANCNYATSFSYERINHSMWDALSLVVCAGFKFSMDDFDIITREFRSGYWMHSDAIYREAVAADNMSACQAFEAWAKQTPIIADDVDVGKVAGRHGGGRRGKARLCVGADFQWNGERVTVTSMKGDSCTACSYKPRRKDSYENKILHRYTITVEDIRRDRAEKKERQDIIARGEALVKEGWDAKVVCRRLGAKTRDDFAKLPIVKARKAIEAMESEHAAKTQKSEMANAT